MCRYSLSIVTSVYLCLLPIHQNSLCFSHLLLIVLKNGRNSFHSLQVSKGLGGAAHVASSIWKYFVATVG